MKKAKTMFIKNLRYLCLVGVIALGLMTIVGTGGGDGDGGGASSEITYTGLTTQATISESNAEDLLIGAYEGGRIGTAVGIDAIQTGESAHIGCPCMLKVSRILEGSLRKVDLASRSGGTFIGAIYTVEDTVFGDCGGSASYSISVDNQTGDFNGSFNFDSYCDDGVTINGGVSFSGQIDVDTDELLIFTFSFNSLTCSTGSDSFTLNGSISWDVTGSPATVTMNMYLRDNITNKVYWVQNYTIDATEGAGYVDVDVSGRYYDPDYGYITITTSPPLRIYDNDDYPSEGILVITGNTGSEGGHTRARLTALSPTTYQVEADTDGDGLYDDYDSGILYW